MLSVGIKARDGGDGADGRLRGAGGFEANVSVNAGRREGKGSGDGGEAVASTRQALLLCSQCGRKKEKKTGQFATFVQTMQF